MAKDTTDKYFRPLANDERGLAFELPGDAKKWRVQHMTRARGRQEALFTLEHEPLEAPIEAKPAELAEAMRAAAHEPAGRYRLVPVDAQGQQVGNQCAFVVFRTMQTDRDNEDEGPRNAGYPPSLPPGPTNAAFDMAAVAKAISDGIQRAIEPTLTTMRNTLEKLVDANVATSTGLLRARLPLPAEQPEEFDDAEAEPAQPPSPADQMRQIFEMVGQVSTLLQGIQSQQSQSAPEPRNGEATAGAAPASFAGLGDLNGHSNGTNGAPK